MVLLALYQNWRPWHETDFYAVAIIESLLLLLVVFLRCRSFLANGVLVGGSIGCLCALISDDDLYRTRISHVEWGIFGGLLFGVLAKSLFPVVKKLLKLEQKPSVTASALGPPGHVQTLAFWASALGTCGISLGLAMGIILKMTWHEIGFWTAGLVLTGCVIGVAAWPLGRRSRWIRACLELGVFVTVMTGICTLIGWRVVLPILLFGINPPFSTEFLFRVTSCTCATAGALIGLIAWTVKTVRCRRASDSPWLDSTRH